MKEFFENYVENAFGQYEQATFKFVQFERNYKKFFPADKNTPVLDIGIGRGEMLACMKKWGYSNSLGVDISPSTVSFCRSIGLPCELTDDTTGWLSKHERHFAVITLLDVLEHVRKNDTMLFLQALRNALQDNGLAIIQVPNLQAPDGQLHRYNDFTHEVGYVEHSLQQVLLTAGFRNITFSGFEDSSTVKWKQLVKRAIRGLYWKYVKFTRFITGNLNPPILHPVFFAVVKK